MDFAALIEPVARELWGDPNPALSHGNELRWGSHGGRVVRLDKGTWADHAQEHPSINDGGVLDLVTRETGLDHKSGVGWLKEHGYQVDDDRAPRSNGHAHANSAAASGLGKEVAHYDYTDEGGNLIFQVVRFEPKTFRQRRRDDTGAWSWSARGIRQVPYRLPEITEAIALDHPVLVVEGEKDADNIAALFHMAATCNAGGAGKWRAELNAFFAGADVVVLPDNDPQATGPDGSLRFHDDGRPVLVGQDHADDIARQLTGIARRVRMLMLPGLPPKGDVSDWLADGGTIEQLYALIEQTPEWSGPALRSKFGGKRWEEIGIGDVSMLYRWLVEDVIPLGEIALMFGESGSGKSFDAFDMAMASARGLTWNGHNVEPGLNVYVAAEAGKGFEKRKLAYIQHNKLDPLQPLPFYLMTRRPNFFGDDAEIDALVGEIDAVCKLYKQPLVALYLDTLSALTPGMNENRSEDVSILRQRLERLRTTFGAAVILIHHKPKHGDTPRGHGSLTNDFETTIEFETTGRDPNGKPIHRATVRKQREGKSGIQWSFTLPVIEVGRNKWGNAETTCVVETYEVTIKNRGGYSATPNELLFLNAFFEAIDKYGVPPPAGLPKAISRAVEFRHVRAEMKSRMVGDTDDPRLLDQRFRVAFKRAGEKLRDVQVIGVQDELVWSTGKPVRGLSSDLALAPTPAPAPEAPADALADDDSAVL